jgi:polysaccharide export outer membrane protein
MRVFVLRGTRPALCLFAMTLAVAAQQKSGEAQSKPPAGARTGPEAVEPLKPEAGLAAETVGAPVDPKTYKLGAEDIIYIRVWREPELSGAAIVRPDGQITMPLIGEIQATGLTPLELGARVTEKLSQFVNRPEVIVSVQSVRSKRYYVTGEVLRSGAFPLVVPTTVLEALTLAGGFREFANTKNITVLRGGKKFRFNYKDVIKGKNMSQNILLENGDYIIVS